MPGGVAINPTTALNINIIYYKSDLDNKRKAQVQHTTSLCFLDSKSHPRAFLSARFPKPKTSYDMWTLGPSMDHWSHLQPGSAQKRRLACFFWHLPRFESFKSQHSTSISLQTPDQRSNVHGASFIQWKHVEGHVKLFTNALRDACVPQKQSSKTTRAENYQSHSSSSYHFWFWCCFGNRKFGGFLNSEDLKRDLQRKQMIL